MLMFFLAMPIRRWASMPDVMTVNDVMVLLHIGRNKAYRLFNMKSFPSFRFEDRHYITKKDFEIWMERIKKLPGQNYKLDPIINN